MRAANEKAWGDFWSQQQHGEGGGGCLPDGWRGIEETQREEWSGFAAHLPEPCRLLDLATGDGRVLRWMRKERPDLVLVGVDLAPELPPAPEGTTVKPGVPMEELPFGDASFDAVVSQFGFEYGDVEKASAEVARVTAPGGMVGLITHRRDGPILAHNWDRRVQIGWLFDRKSLFGIAQETLADRGSAFAAPPMAITRIGTEAAQRFGSQSVAMEIVRAVERTLMLPAAIPAKDVQSTLEQIAGQARNEVERIISLERACRTTADRSRIAKAFENAGLVEVETRPLNDGRSSAAFADFRLLRSPS